MPVMIETLRYLCPLRGLDRLYMTLIKRALALGFFLDFARGYRWRSALRPAADGSASEATPGLA
jgi:hypothetical protein